ncbi:MAG: KH domain-containing protein [Acidobacteriota bacterium]
MRGGGLTVADVVAEAQGFLKQVLERTKLELDVNLEAEGKTIKVNISGKDKSLVLADKARFLYALNHLLNQIFFRRSLEGVGFWVDSDGYRAVRERELELIAEKAAERARVTGQAVVLQPMPATERRIVHLALAGRRDVRTESEGRGRNRRVSVIPVRGERQ